MFDRNGGQGKWARGRYPGTCWNDLTLRDGRRGLPDGLWKLDFLASGNFLALAMLPRQMRWITSVAGAATGIVMLIGWLGEVRGDYAKACIAEIKGV